ncbi:MAG: hypothetical protein WBX14_08440 [Candidatus Udaeobacter sp.]
MRSRQLDLTNYDTDKIAHHYFEIYDPILAPWVDKELKLVEIGVHKGGSLQLWRDYFPRATIVGIDLKLPENFIPGERIQVFEGSQSDEQFLSEVANRTAPEGFDIIIDDASHIGELSRRTFWHLFDRHLKPGGLYALEDWCTGYLDGFPDGKAPNLRNFLESQNPVAPSIALAENMKVPVRCHSYGMVGFVKELIDEQGAASITTNYPAAEHRASKFESVHVTPFIVFVTKVGPILTASPNPVPAGDTKGRTTISWNALGETGGKIYVSINGDKELLFVAGRQGSSDANWIDAGSNYEFRLYNRDHTKLLNKILVTRVTQ